MSPQSRLLLPAVAACLALAALAPTASADHLPALGGTVDCMYYYKATHVTGPYWVLQRDSCHVQVYECPAGYAPPTPPCSEVGSLSMAAAPGIDFPTCVDLALGSLCASPYWPGCNLWVEWTGIPLQDSCLYRTEPLVTSAAAGPESTPDVQCMDVYSATQVPGTGYWIVRRNSCSVQLYECPAGYAPPAPPCHEAQIFTTQAAPGIESPPIYCMPYEREVAVSDGLSVVQGGCGSYVRVCDQRVTPDWDGDVSCLTDDLVATSSQPNCLPYRHETEVYSVTVVQDGCSGADVFICDEDAVAYASKPDPNGFVMCTWESTGLVGPVLW